MGITAQKIEANNLKLEAKQFFPDYEGWKQKIGTSYQRKRWTKM